VTATHTYAVSGNYLIGLTVLDNSGMTGSVSPLVNVVIQAPDNPPVAAFTPTTTAGSLTVSVDASASTDDNGIVGYSWIWGDLTAAGSGVTATHTYALSGTYTITLTVTDTIGQTDSVSHDVTVSNLAPPVASFTALPSSGGVATVDASASTGTGTLTYAWNFGDSITSTGMTHVHTYTSSGTYTITLTVKDSTGQSSSTTRSVTVVNNAVPPFPYIVFGTTFASNGVTPLPSVMVSVTNVRTSETLIGTISDVDGLYSVDISVLYVTTGDGVIVSGLGPGGQTGTNSGVADLGTPYLNINLTLT
jgi:PKD repeat protein